MEIDNSKWFLVYTKAREEEMAKRNLQNQGFTTFFPMISYEKIKKPSSFSLKVMFPRYLFVKLNLEEDSWSNIKSTRGVSHLVVFGNKLTAVPDSVMEFLKSKVDDQDIIQQRVKRQLFQKGEKLVIKDGVFKGKEATFLTKIGKERVRILLKLMNESIIAEVPDDDIGPKITLDTFKL